MDKIDKYGLCPNCKCNWNGRDIHEELNSLSVFTHKTAAELKAIAGNYGHTEFNKPKFSKVIVVEPGGDKMFYKCPNIRCGHIFDPELGLEYESIQDANRGIEYSIAGISTELLTKEEIEEKFGREINEDDLPL